MKTLLSLLLFILIQSSTLLCQNLLNGPECVAYDSLNNRYIVDNWTNGNVVSIDSAGNQFLFKTGLGHTYGNYIKDSTVYISNGNSIIGLNLFNPLDTVFYIHVPSASQMDGITIDNSNTLYTVDVLQAVVIKINLISPSSSVFATGLSSHPQDIIFDERNNRLLVCSWYSNSPIQAISLVDSSVTNLVSTIYGSCDGLAMDEKSNVYFSTWANNSVYYYDSTFTNPPILLKQGLNGPSNLCYNYKDKKIAVTNFNSNTLELIELNPTSVDEGSLIPLEFQLEQNYPNPFNPFTTISYQIPELSYVTLKVYNVLGNQINILVNEVKSAGNYSVEWNAEQYSSGVYLYCLTTGDIRQTKKMTLLK